MSYAQIELIKRSIDRALNEGDEARARDLQEEIEEIERDLDRRQQFEEEVEYRRQWGDW